MFSHFNNNNPVTPKPFEIGYMFIRLYIFNLFSYAEVAVAVLALYAEIPCIIEILSAFQQCTQTTLCNHTV